MNTSHIPYRAQGTTDINPKTYRAQGTADINPKTDEAIKVLVLDDGLGSNHAEQHQAGKVCLPRSLCPPSGDP